MMYLHQTKPVAIRPISIQQFKDHLRVTNDEQDEYISSVLSVAIKEVESVCGIAFMSQSWELTLDSFPIKNYGFSSAYDGPICLNRTPLIKVDSVEYKDLNGLLQTWNPSLYQVAEYSNRIEIDPGYLETYPDTRYKDKNAVLVKFRAGYRSPITVDISTNTIDYIDNPYKDGDRVFIGYRDTDGSLPAELNLYIGYYVINSSVDSFKLSFTSGGSAIDFTTAGSGELYVYKQDIPDPLLQAVMVLGAHLFENRQNTITGSISSVPNLYESLISEYRNWSF